VTVGVISGLKAKFEISPDLSVSLVSSLHPTSSQDFASQIAISSTSGQRYSSKP
jgi:hypothetical protein